MAQQVRDLVDRTPMPDKLRCQAMAYQMGAGDIGKLDPGSPQCRSHYPGNDAAAVDGAHGRNMLQKDALAVALRSCLQNILGKRLTRFL